MLSIGKVGADCINYRDFIQYYNRGSYFGWPAASGAILPSHVYTTDGNVVLIRSYTKQGDTAAEQAVAWNVIKERGIFGSPLLGNTVIGDSYVYLSRYATRESLKGLRTQPMLCTWFDPAHCARYAVNSLMGVSRGSKDWRLLFPMSHAAIDMQIMYHVYNPLFYRFHQAVELLTSGALLGAPLSHDVGLFFKRGSDKIHVSFRSNPDVATLSDEGNEIEITHPKYDLLLPFLQATARGNV